MSKRSDIIDGSEGDTARSGLVYTELAGWIDLGHARGDDIQNIWSQMLRGESNNSSTYDVTYRQSMAGFSSHLTIGKQLTWRLRKRLPFHQKQSIALAMMMTVARRFEHLQSSFPFSWSTDSGFSGEDLVSDLLGFYRIMFCMNHAVSQLQPVSLAEALKRWDHYGKTGSWKNETFRPLLFPNPTDDPHTSPYSGQLPDFMMIVSPYNNWNSGDVGIVDRDRGFIMFGRNIKPL